MVDYTYKDIINSLAQKLAEAGFENSYWEARELAGCALGFNCRGKFDPLTPADADGVKMCAMLLARRLTHEPLQYIIGEWDLYSRTFEVGPGVLIPRADTETLIDLAVKKAEGKKGLTVLDLCAGSGCIGITLGNLLDCERVICVEKYETAFDYLTRNIKRLGGAEAFLGDVLDAKTVEALPQADMIVCNPPYITNADMQKLQKEVTFEPREALCGGEDGLDFYRDIVRLWKNKLKPDGVMIFEIGAGQEDEVMQIMIQAGLSDVRTRRDMAGIDRCVSGKRVERGMVNLYVQLDSK